MSVSRSRRLSAIGSASTVEWLRLLRHALSDAFKQTPLETTHGGLRGYRLEYFQRDKTVQVEVVDGRVVAISQQQN
jgi:hypothetical protein